MVDVVDASVAIKWFVDEPGRGSALEILQKLIAKPDRFFVPELFYFELAHVLKKVLPVGPREQHLFGQLLLLPIGRMPMNNHLFLGTQKFQSLGLSGYDAAYVALAEIVSGSWVTYDEKAHAKIAHLSLSRLLD